MTCVWSTLHCFHFIHIKFFQISSEKMGLHMHKDELYFKSVDFHYREKQ